MLALFVALLAAVLLTPETTFAQTTAEETIWASVIFSRTGERTPTVLGTLVPQLTSLGARQQHQTGEFFRQRYFGAEAPLFGLNEHAYDPLQTYVLALDKTFVVSSALAFMQGFYPPVELEGELDPSSVLANGTYIENPLNGYQYPHIQTVDYLSPESVYLDGSAFCNAFASSVAQWAHSPAYNEVEEASQTLYNAVGRPLLEHVMSDSRARNYRNAYAIYDFLNYQNTHNTTVASMFESNLIAPDEVSNILPQLRWLADQQQTALHGNLSTPNPFQQSSHPAFPNNARGSISTIAGNTLAAKLLDQFQLALRSNATQHKLSLLFGEHEPLTSLFALLGLSSLNSNFNGLPDFASVAVFELFTPGPPPNISDSSTGSLAELFPGYEELWVRFYFRNGTDDDELQAYPLFGRGPSATELSLMDFETEMADIMLIEVGDWCQVCGGSSAVVFCEGLDGGARRGRGGSGNSAGAEEVGGKSSLSGAVGGVVGAVVALVVAAAGFAGFLLLGGFRVHKVERGQRRPNGSSGGGGGTIGGGGGGGGGFKGSAKLASDPDLVSTAKGGAGASVVRSTDNQDQERIGSWELGKNVGGLQRPGEAVTSRPSWEEDGDRIDPFRDPVKADERV